MFGRNIEVLFVESEATIGADYGNGVLWFNVSRLGKGFFDNPLDERVFEWLYHELPHENGFHHEKAYQNTKDRMAGKFTAMALRNPDWFRKASA